MVELDDERDPVDVAAGHRTQAAERGGDGAALPGHRQLAQVGRVEVEGVLGEAGRRRVLDALVDGQDRQVAGPTEPAVPIEGPEAAEHRRGTVGVPEDPVEEVRAREHEPFGRESLGLVMEEGVGFVTEQRGGVHAASLTSGPAPPSRARLSRTADDPGRRPRTADDPEADDPERPTTPNSRRPRTADDKGPLRRPTPPAPSRHYRVTDRRPGSLRCPTGRHHGDRGDATRERSGSAHPPPCCRGRPGGPPGRRGRSAR